MLKFIGQASIHPALFYSGKIAGYAVWLITAAAFVFTDRLGRMTAREWIALAVTAGGLALTVVSMVNLGRSTRLGLPVEKTEFKTGGLYRFSRNPMYLGFDLTTIGAALFMFQAAVFCAGAYSLLVYHLIILAEEKFLAIRYPEKYPEYRRKVRRYF